MKRTLAWLLLWTFNYVVTVRALRFAIPIWMDGGGPMPSLYWGHAPTPSLGEYYEHQTYFDFLFLVPYLQLSLCVTAIEWAAPALIIRRRPGLAGNLFAASLATLAGLIAASLLWDITVLTELWGTTLLLLVDNWWDDFEFYRMFVAAYGTAAILGGLAEVVRHRYLSANGRLAAP